MYRSNTQASREQIKNLLQAAEQRKQTNTAEAIRMLQDAAQLLPNLHVVNDSRSDRNITQDRSTQEILYLSKRGNILYELREYQEAANCYLTIKGKLPQNSEVCKAYGDCLRKQERYHEAIQEYETGLMKFERDDTAMPTVKAAMLNSKGLTYMELKDYRSALADFDAAISVNGRNPLYHCNKGHAVFALGRRGAALMSFKQANELVRSRNFENLTSHNVNYIENTLRKFVEDLESLDNIPLQRADNVLANREMNFVKLMIKNLAGTDVETDEHHQGDNDIAQLRETKQKINYLQQDPRLYEYYDGFLFTLCQSYATAVVVNSGQLTISTGNNFDYIIKAISLLPLVGEQVSGQLQNLNNFVQEAQVRKAASNVCKFATTSAQFEEIAQDAVSHFVLEKRNQIKAFQESDLETYILPGWASRFQGIVDAIIRINGRVDEMLYGNRMETVFQKLGCQEANTVISDFIASGTIYGGIPAIQIPPPQKKQKLIDIALRQVDSIQERRNQSSVPSQKKSSKNSCGVWEAIKRFVTCSKQNKYATS